EIQKVQRAQNRLESNFGLEKTVTVRWYAMGLERTKSVARIERADGKGIGTAWLVRAEDFFTNRTGPLLITNAHVVNATGAGGALRPSQAIANFQGLQKTFTFANDIVWSSPATALDATFLAFAGDPPGAQPIPLSPDVVDVDVPPQRVYIMGHPDGPDLEIAMHDNKLVNSINPFLHYRTPTEGGNSGSPVFDDVAWQAVALHHAGEPTSDANGKKPPYQANEGIAVTALIGATKK